MALNKTVASLVSLACIAVAVHADTIEVTNTDIAGPGSLAAAIDEANTDPSLSNIVFNIPGGGRITAGQLAWFPEITSQVEINGANAGGEVILEGAGPIGPGAPVSGFVFESGSDNSVVENIKTEGFLNAVEIKGSKVTVKNSTFTSPFARGVLVDNSVGSLIMGNTFEGTAELSASIDNSEAVAFLGNTVNGGELMVRNSQGTVIGATGADQGNIFDGNGLTEGAVLVASGSNGTRFMNNTVTNQSKNGVAFYGVDSSSIAFNNFSNNKLADVKFGGGKQNSIFRNTITGDALAVEAGVTLEGTVGSSVYGNILDGARIVVDGGVNNTIGGILDDGNTIKNDPQGVSAYAAVIVDGAGHTQVINNDITDNASHGIFITNESGFTNVYANTITGNGRSGIKAVSGVNNSFSQNVITDHGASAGGGVNSISLVGSANNQKESPVITSVERNHNIITVSGTTSAANDKVEVFVSSQSDNGLPLLTDAARYAAVAYAADTTWSVEFTAAPHEGPAAIYLTATATDKDNNTSELAVNEKLVMEDGIVGPETVTAGTTVTYEVESIEGVNYQWWISGDATITSGNGSNKITAVFNTAGTVVPVSVGYSDPNAGWITENLSVVVE